MFWLFLPFLFSTPIVTPLLYFLVTFNSSSWTLHLLTHTHTFLPCCLCFVQPSFSTGSILILPLPLCCITVLLPCSPRYASAKPNICSQPVPPILSRASHSLFACTLTSLRAPVFSQSSLYPALPVCLSSIYFTRSVTGDSYLFPISLHPLLPEKTIPTQHHPHPVFTSYKHLVSPLFLLFLQQFICPPPPSPVPPTPHTPLSLPLSLTYTHTQSNSSNELDQILGQCCHLLHTFWKSFETFPSDNIVTHFIFVMVDKALV